MADADRMEGKGSILGRMGVEGGEEVRTGSAPVVRWRGLCVLRAELYL